MGSLKYDMKYMGYRDLGCFAEGFGVLCGQLGTMSRFKAKSDMIDISLRIRFDWKTPN